MAKNHRLKKLNLAVVIVSYNTAKILDDCIEAVQKSMSVSSINGKIYVIDNNSKDNSVAVGNKKGAKVIANNVNRGFAAAVNQGLIQGIKDNSNYFLILNPDAIIAEDTLKLMIEAIDSNPSYGAIGPSLIDSDGKDTTAGYYLKAPSFLSVTFYSTFLRPYFMRQKFFVKHLYQEADLSYDRKVDQIPGACLLTTKTVLDKVGLMDEDYAIWYEDVDWCYRARKKGYLMWFCSQAKVDHKGGVTFKEWQSLDKAVTFYVSLKTFFKKHKPVRGIFVQFSLVVNSLILFIKNRDKSNLVFIKRFLLEKRGKLPA